MSRGPIPGRNDQWTVDGRQLKVHLRPGFQSKRQVLTEENIWVDVLCKVEESELEGRNVGTMPNFVVEAHVAPERTLTETSTNATTACQRVLLAINACTAHKWLVLNFSAFSTWPLTKEHEKHHHNLNLPRREPAQVKLQDHRLWLSLKICYCTEALQHSS